MFPGLRLDRLRNTKESDWVEVKRVYRYLKHTIDKITISVRKATEDNEISI